MYIFLQFNFRGIISSCFEAHLAVYVELEEKTLMEHLEKLVQVENNDLSSALIYWNQYTYSMYFVIGGNLGDRGGKPDKYLIKQHAGKF